MVGLPKSVKGVVAGICGMTALAAVSPLASKGASSPARPNQASLCLAREVPLFTCAMGRKVVSVCSGSGTPTAYRYGTPGHVELTSRDLTIADRGFSGGGETQITALNKGYAYIVYNKTVRTSFGANGQHDSADASGLIVRKGNRTLSSAKCSADAVISSKARTLIPAGAYLDH